MLKTVLVLITIYGLLVETDALNCYQCHEMLVQSPTGDFPDSNPFQCASKDMRPCSSEHDTCSTSTYNYARVEGGATYNIYMITRACGSEKLKENVEESAVCGAAESNLKSQSAGAEINDFICKLETCTTDSCNSEGKLPESNIKLGDLSCYQCQDVFLNYENNDIEDHYKYTCSKEDARLCTDYFDTCRVIRVSYLTESEGEPFSVDMKIRNCGKDGVADLNDEDTVCKYQESSLGATYEKGINDFKCELETCTTDNCNRKGANDPDKENYSFASPLKVELVLILAVLLQLTI